MENKNSCLEPFDFNFQGLDCRLEFDLSKCYENGSCKVTLRKRSGETRSFPFATISQDIPHIDLEEGEFIVNTWETYSELVNFIKTEKDYFEDTGKQVETQYGISPVWKIK